MSKAVLLSTQPKWCEKICNKIGENADGTPIYEKSVEVRKTRPKIDTPFTVYIYQTKKTWVYNIFSKIADWQSKVIGEFVCDRITFLGNVSTDPWSHLLGDTHEYHKRLVTEKACLTESELHEYGGQWAWHISNLVIYDKPKELREFTRIKKLVDACEIDCINCGFCKIKKPPQSWCYVEELRE